MEFRLDRLIKAYLVWRERKGVHSKRNWMCKGLGAHKVDSANDDSFKKAEAVCVCVETKPMGQNCERDHC